MRSARVDRCPHAPQSILCAHDYRKLSSQVARTTPVRKATRALAWLGVIIIGLAALNVLDFFTSQVPKGTSQAATFAPKLGLDLIGGTEIILQPQLAKGQAVTSDQLNQAVAIIRERIDAAGVAAPSISTQGQGGSENIQVQIPGALDKQTQSSITKAAKLSFRAVLVESAATTSTVSPTPTPGATSTPGATPSPSASLRSTPTSKPTNGSDLAYVTPALQAEYDNFNCKSKAAAAANLAPENKPLITCDAPVNGTYAAKYILGPVELSGTAITDAEAALTTTQNGASTGEWGVNITFNSAGGAKFESIGTRLIALTSPQNQFAVVLDGQVITNPQVEGVSNKPQITGNFNQTSATALAQQLKFGALPISFRVLTSNNVSAQLGSASLFGGLLAGGIGLLLVIIYSFFQYRLLGLVTIVSLGLSGIITYELITYLSWQADYRLSLAGVAGLIVAIGITADSFIVYFERIRDELRDGRGLESSVEAGWKRAIRTILASDSVNLLAALILFILAVGDVKGFALTLGLTTIIDVIVVSLFTHPTLQLLARVPFFYEGHRASGLDPNALGAVYRGRAQFRAPVAVAAKNSGSSREAARRQTIAERKAAEAEANRPKGKDS
ncbi:MAG: preprotein translocase subunit SecD [Actinomycetota bacterium]|nr:preprotein translocase subunit SecD [Actinomycetota bacterium]